MILYNHHNGFALGLVDMDPITGSFDVTTQFLKSTWFSDHDRFTVQAGFNAEPTYSLTILQLKKLNLPQESTITIRSDPCFPGNHLCWRLPQYPSTPQAKLGE
jgi:hypothetical protein